MYFDPTHFLKKNRYDLICLEFNLVSRGMSKKYIKILLAKLYIPTFQVTLIRYSYVHDHKYGSAKSQDSRLPLF